MLIFDFNNMFAENIGPKSGLDFADIEGILDQIQRAHESLREKRTKKEVEWFDLPHQDKRLVTQIISAGEELSKKFDNIISLGIGGSYLGNKMLQDAMCSPYYNEFDRLRAGRPKIYFEGNNVDPTTVKVLLTHLNLAKTLIIVISKSGETTETKAVFEIIKDRLIKEVGEKNFHKHIIAITDEKSGSLRDWIGKVGKDEFKRDKIINFPVPDGVGGRFSVLSPSGLITAAISGIDIKGLLEGAASMDKQTQNPDVFKNPAYLYAALQYLSYIKKDKDISIIMPFSEQLKTFADWYVQLLAESLGKKLSVDRKVVNVGRTPIGSVGTKDLHSTQQNNAEGEYNKTVTFIKVENFKSDLAVPKESNDFLVNKKLSEILNTAQSGTEWALAMEKRPSCCISLSEINAHTIGELIFFFEVATAFEGELLNVNAFDQPGVQSYKDYMFSKLGKEGVELPKTQFKKNPKWVI